MSTFIKRMLIPALLVLPIAAGALERKDLLPAEPAIKIRISDASGFLARIKTSPLGKLWADQQFQDFIGHPDEDTWKAFFFDGEMDMEDKIMLEQLKMLKGECIFSMGIDADEPCVVAAMSEEDFLRSLDLDEKLAEVSDEPLQIVKDSFQGILLIQHIDGAGTPEESFTWQAHVGNTLLLGDSREWLEQSIVRLKKETISEPEGNPVLEVSMPLGALIRQGLEEDAEEEENPEVDTMALLEAMGLMGIDDLSCRMELRNDEMIVDNRVIASSLDKGIFTVMDYDATDMPTVGFIPADLSILEVGRFNLLRLWREIPVMLSTAMPSVKPQYDMAINMIRQQIGIDIEQDLLVNLGTRYVSFSVTENDNLISVMAIDLKNSQAFQRGLEALIASPMLQPQVNALLDVSEFLGQTLYVTRSETPDEAIAFSVIGNYLLYGHPDGVRQVMRSESSDNPPNTAFQQTEFVQGLQRQVPASAFGYSAIDWKKSVGSILRELMSPEVLVPMQQQWAASGTPLPPPDFTKMPPADHIASFFNITYQYIERTNEGLHQQIIFKY